MCRAVGKRGRKRNCLSKEQTASERIDNGRNSTAKFRPNHARRRLVDATAADLSGIVGFHRLFDVGRVSGTQLLFRQLYLAVLFAGTFWRFTAQLVRTKANVVAGMVNFFAGS